LEDKTTVGTPV